MTLGHLCMRMSTDTYLQIFVRAWVCRNIDAFAPACGRAQMCECARVQVHRCVHVCTVVFVVT